MARISAETDPEITAEFRKLVNKYQNQYVLGIARQ